MKKIFMLFVMLGIVLFAAPVYASNTVDYTLTITKDYKFKEVINYEISDYEQFENGYNPFARIVEDDNIEVDILGKTTYKKTKKFSNNKYHVNLSYTHSEYSLSNSIFLNDCFENSDYNYDIDSYSFEAGGGFYCLNGDSLKITLITDLNVSDTNATISGNKYIWNPTDTNFSMNIKMDKKYEKKSSDNIENSVTDDLSKEEFDAANSSIEDDDEDSNTSDETIIEEDNNNDSSFSNIILIVIIVIILIVGVIASFVLIKKKNNLNKL